MAIILSSDSTCDLGEELCARYGVHTVPYHIILGEGEFLDGVDMFPDHIYAIYKEKKILPKTAAINTEDYIAHFSPFVAQGHEVIHLTLGSGISTSYSNCLAAAAQLSGIHVVDSRSLSSGSGLLVIEAAERIACGTLPAAQIAAEVQALTDNCHASFVIETLEFLYKGGRCSALSMLGANVLGLKPCIEVDSRDGRMGVGKKYRGALEKALSQYVADKLQGRGDLVTSRVFITHAGISEERVELVRGLIAQYAQFDEVFVTRAGCTISSHCGPNTLGILFMTK